MFKSITFITFMLYIIITEAAVSIISIRESRIHFIQCNNIKLKD